MLLERYTILHQLILRTLSYTVIKGGIMSLIVNNDSHILWHETLRVAEDRCSVTLDRELEAYLVALLTRYTDKPEWTKRVYATALMEAMDRKPAERSILLQQVGDQCLLFSGLFPEAADRKQVKIRYFVEIGRSAYANISRKASDLYGTLATRFVLLMDVLQSIRPETGMLPLAAYEQWESLGSQRALKILQSYSTSIPFKVSKHP